MSVVLSALDGSNPLAFLAALGAFRLLSLEDGGVHLRWTRRTVWHPELVGMDSADRVCDLLEKAAIELPLAEFGALGENITVDPATFSGFVEPAYEQAKHGRRDVADYAAAFGSEVLEQRGKDRIEYTDWCFITGSGRQDFVKTMRGLVGKVKREHIQDALFGEWKRGKSLSMRWDPADAAEYAFRWGNPSAEGASSVWGANLLAVHALPLFPAQPTSKGLRTTGFHYGGGQWREFTWPIWDQAIGLDTVRSLLASPDLQHGDGRLEREELRARGITEVYRSPRVRIGQGRNFKVNFRPARAV